MSDRIKKLGRRSQRGKQEVLLLNPTDQRGIPLEIATETDLGLISKITDGQEHRTWKHGPGWSFPKKTYFFAIEGRPVTSYINHQDKMRSTSLKKFIIWAWGENGEALFNKLPPNMKGPLEGNNMSATVTVVPAKLERGAEHILSKVRASQILKDTSIDMLNDLGKSVEKKDAVKDIMTTLFNICLGAFGLYFLEHALQWF